MPLVRNVETLEKLNTQLIYPCLICLHLSSSGPLRTNVPKAPVNVGFSLRCEDLGILSHSEMMLSLEGVLLYHPPRPTYQMAPFQGPYITLLNQAFLP